MEITSKGRYAVKVMADIARAKKEYVSLAEISERNELSQKYLEKIISILLKANLVVSARGKDGGYKLARPCEQITIKQILDATGDGAKIVDCLECGCAHSGSCDTVSVWGTLKKLIDDYLASVTLSMLLSKTGKS